MKGREGQLGAKKKKNDSWVTWMKHRAHAGKAKFQTGSIMGDFWGTLVMGHFWGTLVMGQPLDRVCLLTNSQEVKSLDNKPKA